MVLQCHYTVILVCNGKPRIHLDSNTDAWLRRLVVLSLKTPTHEQHFGRMVELILKTESAGLHNWLLEGRAKLAKDKLQLTPNPRSERESSHIIAGVRFTCCVCPMLPRKEEGCGVGGVGPV